MDFIQTRKDPKVFERDGVVMGFCGSFRMGQLLRFNLHLPRVPESGDIYEWMIVEFIPKVRDCLKDGGLVQVSDNVESGNGSFMVGVRDQLFIIEEDFQVADLADNYAAIGCGDFIALGSLHSTEGKYSSRKRLEMALNAASYHSAWVQAPYTILRTQ